MAYVKVYFKGDSEEDKNAALESALKAFKRQVENEGILKDLKKREEFVSNTIIKRNKLKEAQKRERLLKKKRRFYR